MVGQMGRRVGWQMDRRTYPQSDEPSASAPVIWQAKIWKGRRFANVQPGRQTDERTGDTGTDGRTDGWTDVKKEEWAGKWTAFRCVGEVGGWTVVWADGRRATRQVDGRAGGQAGYQTCEMAVRQT